MALLLYGHYMLQTLQRRWLPNTDGTGLEDTRAPFLAYQAFCYLTCVSFKQGKPSTMQVILQQPALAGLSLDLKLSKMISLCLWACGSCLASRIKLKCHADPLSFCSVKHSEHSCRFQLSQRKEHRRRKRAPGHAI